MAVIAVVIAQEISAKFSLHIGWLFMHTKDTPFVAIINRRHCRQRNRSHRRRPQFCIHNRRRQYAHAKIHHSNSDIWHETLKKKKRKRKKKRKKHQAWNIRIIFIHIKSHHVPSFTYKHIHGWLKREKRKRWRERLERKRGISSSQLVMNKLSYQHQTLCANKSSKPTTQRQRAHSSIPLLTCHFPSTLTAWWWAKQLCPPLNIAHITHTSTYSQLRTFLFSLPSPASQNQAKRFLVLKARKKKH